MHTGLTNSRKHLQIERGSILVASLLRLGSAIRTRDQQILAYAEDLAVIAKQKVIMENIIKETIPKEVI